MHHDRRRHALASKRPLDQLRQQAAHVHGASSHDGKDALLQQLRQANAFISEQRVATASLEQKFNTVKEDETILVKIIGQRFELNDSYISVIAEIVEKPFVEKKKRSSKPKLILKE